MILSPEDEAARAVRTILGQEASNKTCKDDLKAKKAKEPKAMMPQIPLTRSQQKSLDAVSAAMQKAAESIAKESKLANANKENRKRNLARNANCQEVNCLLK